MAGYVTLLVEATVEPGVAVARHKHPGIKSAYILEGGLELPVEGQQTRMLKAGDGVQIPPKPRMRMASLVMPRPGFSSLMWWRKESRLRLQLRQL